MEEDIPPIQTPLSYATPAAARLQFHWLNKAAILCALVPMGLGLICFALWALTGWFVFTAAGGIVVLLGMGGTVLGTLALVVSLFRQWEARVVAGRTILRRGIWTVALLLVNYPLAFVLFMAAHGIGGRLVITIENRGAASIDHVTIVANDNYGTTTVATTDLGPLASGQSVRFVTRVIDDTGYTCHLTRAGQVEEVRVTHYVDTLRTGSYRVIASEGPTRVQD